MKTRFARAAVLLATAAVALAVVACGGTKSRRAASLPKAKTGEIVTVEGNLSLRGSAPFPLLMLEIKDGETVLIESSGLQDELKSLSGMKVKVEGPVLPPIDNKTPAIDVQSYELLPLPSGDLPVVGKVTVENHQAVLTTYDGKRYWIRGDFADLIKDFEGARMWAAGTVGEYALPEQPADSVPFKVLQYGVIRAPQQSGRY
jgi:hypothetical protein